jgi:hypothetical protein
VARLSYPQAGEPRPAALPPGQRTIGQLVAESIHFYGDNFLRVVLLGVPPAIVAVVASHVSRGLGLTLVPFLSAPLVSAAFVAACVLVLDAEADRRRLLLAWGVGIAVFLPAEYLVLAFIVPGLLWLAAFGLAVPAILVEELGALPGLRRAWRLARADFVHAAGSLATLAIVAVLTQSVLAFLLRGTGGAEVSVALFLASTVVSPLLFVGAALLYVDQSARVE